MSFYCNGKKGICDKIKNSHEFCPLGCEFGDGTGGYDIPDEPMTNGDRIRAMSDEELGSWLCSIMADCDEKCPGRNWCKFGHKGTIAWLKEPTSISLQTIVNNSSEAKND